MSEIRNIVLTGDVADSFGKRGGKRRSRKLGGRLDNTVVHATESPDLRVPQDQKTLQDLKAHQDLKVPQDQKAPQDQKVSQDQTPISKDTPELSGGAKKKVVLNPKKSVQKVVFLEKKPLKKLEHFKQKTRKSPRKIQFSLKILDKKLKTAKNILQHSKEKSLDEIKNILENAKLIKKDSKAPPSMIRQMYSDYMTMKHKAL